MATHIAVQVQAYPMRVPFAISRESRTEARVLVATAEDGGIIGRGECVPYARYGESVESVAAQINGLKAPVDRHSLQSALPPGAARNAVDCALWDLEAKQAEKRVWELAGLPEPQPVLTAYTISLGSPEEMGRAAAENSWRPLLKVKLGSKDDLPRLEAVRDQAPESRIIVDANEGWSSTEFQSIFAQFADLRVEMVEQPLPAGSDQPLDNCDADFDLCADESCHDRESLASLNGRYSMVNIKLDKTGGLTEAIALKKQATEEGYKVMVGCMVGTSLAMAPAVVVAQGADIVDLDGPLLLKEDRPGGLCYEGAYVHPANREFWG